MKDLAFNEYFDVFQDDTNDFGTVEGREAFEQSLSFILSRYTDEIVGSTSRENTLKKISLKANRVVRDSDLVSDIRTLNVQFTESGSVEVSVHYLIGDDYTFILEE